MLTSVLGARAVVELVVTVSIESVASNPNGESVDSNNIANTMKV